MLLYAVFPSDLLSAGYADVTCIDFSETCIDTMQKKYGNKQGLTFKVVDASDLSQFEDNSFDAIIDKGTMDCLVCSNLNKNKVHTYVNEAHRLLKRGGVFAVISYAEPPRRLHYFEKEEFTWQVSEHELPRPAVESKYILQIITKKKIENGIPIKKQETNKSSENTQKKDQNEQQQQEEQEQEEEEEESTLPAQDKRDNHHAILCIKPPPTPPPEEAEEEDKDKSEE
ncbi:MAG: putative S-adenosyl-L-methionine-dependent methyltransferases superfamily protein, partial [Streblomastix strix]